MGMVIEALKKRIREKGLVVPGTNWLGPGNPLDAPPPTCHSDQLAKEHDFDYHYAERASQVRAADRRALAGFAAELVVSGSPYSVIGVTGIGLKYGLESVTGVLYPTGLNRFVGPGTRMRSPREIRDYHRGLDESTDRERENQANQAWENYGSGLVVQMPEEAAGTARTTTERRTEAGVGTSKIPKRQRSPAMSFSGGTPAAPSQPRVNTYNPYNSPPGYKTSGHWDRGAYEPAVGSWFNEEKHKKENITFREAIRYQECAKTVTPSVASDQTVRPSKEVTPPVASARTVLPNMGGTPPVDRQKKLIPASCGKEGCPSGGCSQASEEEDIFNKWNFEWNPSPPIPPLPTRYMTTAEAIELGREERVEIWNRLAPVEVTVAMAGGHSSDGDVPNQKKATGTKPKPARKTSKLTQLNQVDLELVEQRRDTLMTRWSEFGSNSNNIGDRPFKAASAMFEELMAIFTPVLKGLKDLQEELRFQRRVSLGVEGLTESMEKLDERVKELQEGKHSVVTEDILPTVRNQDLAAALVHMEAIFREGMDGLGKRIGSVERKTDAVVGQMESLKRGDLVNLGRKVDVMSRRIRDGPEGGAVTGKPTGTIPKVVLPETSLRKLVTTQDVKKALKSVESGAESARKRGRVNYEESDSTDVDWETVENRRSKKKRQSGHTSASASGITTEGEPKPGAGSSGKPKKGRKRRSKVKAAEAERNRNVRRYETMLEATEKKMQEKTVPPILVEKEKPRSLMEEMEVATEVEANGEVPKTFSSVLMSPPSLRRDLRSNIREEMVTLGVGLEACRPAGKTKILMKPRTNEEAERLTAALKLKGYSVKELSGPSRPLLMKINRVDVELKREDVAGVIYSQNPRLKEKITLQEWMREFKPAFQKGNRARWPEDTIWVCEVSPRVRDLLKDGKSLHIGFARSKAEDYFDVSRCFRCQMFGHSQARCSGEAACARCAGAHDTRQCTAPAEQPRRCVNCARANKPSAHSVEDVKCPAYTWAWKRYVREVKPTQ